MTEIRFNKDDLRAQELGVEIIRCPNCGESPTEELVPGWPGKGYRCLKCGAEIKGDQSDA